MKLILFYFSATFFLLISHDNSYGQNSTQPFKGAKTIILHCSDSTATLYKRFGQHLISKGAIIDNSNNEFLTLKTTPIPTSRYNLLFYLNTTIMGSKIRLNTFYKINVDHLVGVGASSFDAWEYRAGKDNTMNVIYLDVMRLIDGFKTVSIEYQK